MCKSLFDYATPIKPLGKEKPPITGRYIKQGGKDVFIPHKKGNK